MSDMKVAVGALALGLTAVGSFNRLRDTVRGDADTGAVIASTCVGGAGPSLTIAEASFANPGRYSVTVQHAADFGVDLRTATYSVDVPKGASLNQPFVKGLDVWSGFQHITNFKVEPR